MKKSKFDSIEDFMREFKNHDYKAVVLCGLPGSGKSWLGKKIVVTMGAVILASDKIREELFGTARLDLASDEVIREQSRQAYEVMYSQAVETVKEGGKVILDATHLKSDRQKAVGRLLAVSDKVIVVVVKTSYSVMAERMKKVPGVANEKENFYEGWERVVEYFEQGFSRGEYSWPEEGENGAMVVEIDNG